MQPPKIDNSTKEERQAYVLDACTIARRVVSAVFWKVGMLKRSMLTTSKASGVIWNNIGDSDPFYEIIGIIIVNNLQKRVGGLCAWRLFRIRNYRVKNIAPSNKFSADLEWILYTCLYFATRVVLAGLLVFYQPRDKSIIRTPSVCGIKRKELFPILNRSTTCCMGCIVFHHFRFLVYFCYI